MNSPSDNPVQEGERQATATRPLVLPEKFNGTGNFNKWISHFEGIAAINKWTDDDKGLWLKVRLTDKAHVALMRLPNDAHESYASLKAALKERFEPSSKQEVYKAEFESRRKISTESWGDFGDELLQLVDKAFPSLQPEAKEQLALSRYLGQLAPAEVAFGVKQRRPATVNEAVSSTIELESYLSKTLPKNNSVSHVTDEEDQVVGSVQSVQEGLLKTMQKLVERVEKLEMTVPAQHRGFNPQPPRRGRGAPWNPSGPIVCRRCLQPGHYARGCAANINQQAPRFERSAGNGTYGGPNNIPDMQDVNINNIASYFVLGFVYECPLSFLVDTGAGVSLLRGDV